MGLFFAARLLEAGQEVWLLDYRPERAGYLSRHGLELLPLAGQKRHYPLQVVDSAAAIGPCDLVLMQVKAHQTETAAGQLPALLKGGGIALTLQNGIGNLEKMAAAVGPERLLAGVTMLGVTRLDERRIRHAGQGPMVIGIPPGSRVSSQEAAAIAHVFRQAGLDCQIAEEILGVLWQKLLINVGINPVTALTRLPNGQLPAVPGAWRVVAAAVGEASEVALALNLTLPPDPVDRVRQVCQATAANRSSMLQDILAGRPTEIDAINGQIVCLGQALGFPTPVNAALTDLVKALEQGRAAWNGKGEKGE